MKLRYQFLFAAIVLAFGMILGVGIEFRRQIPTLTLTHELSQPLQNEQEARFIVLGDTGSGNKNQKLVASLVEDLCLKEKPDAVLLLGDNFYEHGVSGTDDLQWAIKFERMYGAECSKTLKFYAVLGNHDYEGKPVAQIQYTEVSKGRWHMPSRYFMTHFGNLVDVFAVDTNFPDRCGFDFCSLSWTKSAMTSSKAKWKIVLGHHPLNSGGRYPKPKPFLKATLPGVLCDGKADAYFSGHDHGLQHLKGELVENSCPMNQFVSAGGGGELYDIGNLAGLTEFSLKTHGLLYAKFTPSTADYRFFDAPSKLVVYQYVERAKASQ